MRETIGPRQTILVTSRAETEVLGKQKAKDNVMAVAWHSPLSFQPPMYMIAVGKQRFSHEIISKSKVFVVNFIPYEMKDQTIFCGRNSGRHADKFSEAKLEKLEAERIDCPVLKDALAYLECEVTHQLDAGDHTVFIAKVLKYKENMPGKRLFHLGGEEFTTTIK